MTTSTFVPSKYQQAIFEKIENTNDNLAIEAVAGSGKTTTIVEALKLCTGKTLFLAFNKAIANELASRIPAGIEAATLNSFGWRVCIKNAKQKRIDLDSDKTSYVLRFTVLKVDKNNKEQCAYFYSIKGAISKLVSLAKAHNMHKPTRNDFEMLADKYNVEFKNVEDMDQFYQHLEVTFREVVSCLWKMDFDDQIFMPLYHNWPIPRYDNVMVDEAQDLNPAQIELVCKASGN